MKYCKSSTAGRILFLGAECRYHALSHQIATKLRTVQPLQRREVSVVCNTSIDSLAFARCTAMRFQTSGFGAIWGQFFNYYIYIYTYIYYINLFQTIINDSMIMNDFGLPRLRQLWIAAHQPRRCAWTAPGRDAPTESPCTLRRSPGRFAALPGVEPLVHSGTKAWTRIN